MHFLGKYQAYLADHGQPKRLLQRDSPFMDEKVRDTVKRADPSLNDGLSSLGVSPRPNAKVFAALVQVMLKNGTEISKAMRVIESPRFQPRSNVKFNAQLGVRFIRELEQLSKLLSAIVTAGSFKVVADAIVTQTFKSWALLTPDDNKAILSKVRKMENGQNMLQVIFELLCDKADKMLDADLEIAKDFAGLGASSAHMPHLPPPPVGLSGMQGRRNTQLSQRFGGFQRQSQAQQSAHAHPGGISQQRQGMPSSHRQSSHRGCPQQGRANSQLPSRLVALGLHTGPAGTKGSKDVWCYNCGAQRHKQPQCRIAPGARSAAQLD